MVTHRHALSPFLPGRMTPHSLVQNAPSRPHSGTASLNPERRRPSPFHTALILARLCPIFIFLGGPQAHPTLGMTNRKGWFDFGIGCRDPGLKCETWGTLRFLPTRRWAFRRKPQIPRLRSVEHEAPGLMFIFLGGPPGPSN